MRVLKRVRQAAASCSPIRARRLATKIACSMPSPPKVAMVMLLVRKSVNVAAGVRHDAPAPESQRIHVVFLKAAPPSLIAH